MKKKVFSLLAVVMFLGSSVNFNANALTEAKNQPIEIVTSNEDDGKFCDFLARKVREYLEKKTDLSDEALDAVEDAVAKVCDEYL